MLLSRPLPLRSTAAWSGYHQTQVIPIVIGRCTLSPIPYDLHRRVWVLSDQPIVAVTDVRFGADPVYAWEWRNGVDSTGHAVATIEFSGPVPDGVTPSIDVIGMPHPIIGDVMENPADVVWWILTELAGREYDYRLFDDARALFANAGLFVGGVLAEGEQTLRAAISQILESVGATWSLSIPKIIHQYPQQEGTPVGTLSDISDFQATADFGTLANRLTLSYRRDWAVGDTLLAVTVEDLESQATYGVIPLELSMPWLRDTAAATVLAQRLLSHRRYPLWRYQWKTRTPIVPGTWYILNHPYPPVDSALILGCDFDLERNEAEIMAEAYARAL